MRNAGYSLLALVLSTFLGLVSSAMRSRGLGPQQLGQYTAVVVLPTTLVVFLAFGTNVSAIHLVGSQKLRKEEAMGGVLLLALVVSVAAVPVLMLLVSRVDARWVGEAPLLALRFALGMTPLLLMGLLGAGLLQSEGRIKQFSQVAVVGPFLGAIVLGAFFLVGRITLAVAIASWTATQLASVLLTWGLLGRVSIGPLATAARALLTLLREGFMPYVANVMGYLSRRVDVFLVSGLAGPMALGKYALAYMIGELLWYGASAAGTSLAPSIARVEEAERRDLTPLVCRMVSAILLVGCACVLVLDDWIIPAVFGQAYRDSIIALECLLPGIYAAGIEKVLAGDLIGRGRTKITAASAVVALVGNVALNFVLIPRFGISGAAAASSLSYLAAAVLTLSLYRRMTDTSVRGMLLPTKQDFRVMASLLIRRG